MKKCQAYNCSPIGTRFVHQTIKGGIDVCPASCIFSILIQVTGALHKGDAIRVRIACIVMRCVRSYRQLMTTSVAVQCMHSESLAQTTGNIGVNIVVMTARGCSQP